MNKILFSEKGICKNCKEKNQKLYSVKVKSKVVGFCECCLRGFFMEKGVSDKKIDDFFDKEFSTE